jgi:hypothetical protein
MPLLLALTLLLQAPSAEHGVVASRRGDTVSVQLDDGTEQSFDFSQCPVRWHLDPRVTLPPWWLRVGARMKVERRVDRRNGSIATIDYSLTLVCLGPYQRRAEDEERWLRALQARPDAVPTEDQIRRGERARLDKAPRGCDLALGPEEVEVIEALGSRSHLIRECVTKALRERGIASLRTLIWARHAEDCEIRTRAESLLRELGWEG